MYFIRLIILLLPVIIYANTVEIAINAMNGKAEAQKEWMPTINYLQ
ncbi:MAG: hypothetical protein QM482_08610 [Sulfurospirillum sp.]